MGTRVRRTRIEALLFFVIVMIEGELISYAAAARPRPMCPRESVADYIFGFRDRNYVFSSSCPSSPLLGIAEGNEVLLQKALNMFHQNHFQFVAVLFYASWCPFSRTFQTSFSALSSLYPSIPHFAIEESSIRPSIISKYGVHGFPTLFLINSTMRFRYHGPRTLVSLVAFYNDVTGIKTASLDKGSLDRIGHAYVLGKHDSAEVESCPFSWARSPENLLGQETYLALATAFVVLRLLYLFFPTLLVFAQFSWRKYIRNLRLESLLEHSRAHVNGIMQLFSSLEEPCKKSNLQEGAMNATAWASKSLATVSIGDASTSRLHQ